MKPVVVFLCWRLSKGQHIARWGNLHGTIYTGQPRGSREHAERLARAWLRRNPWCREVARQ